MIRIEDSRVIPASREQVYALLEEPEQVGETQLPNGATISTRTVVTEREPGRRVVQHYEAEPMLVGNASWLRLGRLEAIRDLVLEDHAEGTLVRVESGWRYRPLPLHLFFATCGRGAVRRASARPLDRLGDRALGSD